MQQSNDQGGGGKDVVIRSRDGGFFRIPLAKLPDFVIAEGTVVIQWLPGRYLAIPAAQLREYRIADEELVQLFMNSDVRRALDLPRRRPLRGRRLRRGR